MISLKKFREGNFKKKKSNRENHPVLLFLVKQQKAYTVKELARDIKMNNSSVRSMLDILRKDNLVEHKAPYFAIKEKKVKKVRTKKKVRKTTSKLRRK